ncbi:hypothetical protein [Corynebacterium heidelbergense]|uniref:Primosomal protein n=1 Tax=Corynebacterium heidelbergense TaxID=2055947 RepID=A0A364V8B2_9CORY|nr:hypothetical protein [Corynebacterium heidelbergense]RAV32900.1 hypothetical protein DLJ54_01195 [Corynebacterium heidelbergense]
MASQSSASSQSSARRRHRHGIVPLRLTITSGEWYTLWAQTWIVHGEHFQGFLGEEERAFIFKTPAELLAFITTEGEHDLSSHPQWASFKKDAAAQLQSPTDIDLIELPVELTRQADYRNTRTVSDSFDVLQSLGAVLGISSINKWFGDYSVLANVRRGADHYASQNGAQEWLSVGRLVADNWRTMLTDLEEHLHNPSVDEADTSAAQDKLDAASFTPAQPAEPATAAVTTPASTEEADAAEEAGDPYDNTIWSEVGIDPIRITIKGQHVYTLRCYVDGKPRFLGRYGQINTFPNPRSMVRWIIDATDHDLEELDTWGDVVSAANSGDLEVSVHDSNQYAFTGLREDIAKGKDAVDTDQLGRAYEVMADAADWAEDDRVNRVLVAYPQLQNYIAFMLGSPSDTTPSAPYDEEVRGWTALEEDFVKRFTKF